MTRDYRVQITINYEPRIEHYPDGVTNKLEAMQCDVAAYDEGLLGIVDLIEFGDSVITRVVERES